MATRTEIAEIERRLVFFQIMVKDLNRRLKLLQSGPPSPSGHSPGPFGTPTTTDDPDVARRATDGTRRGSKPPLANPKIMKNDQNDQNCLVF